MTTFSFFDISINPENIFPNGSEVCVNDLIRLKSERRPDIFRDCELVAKVEKFDLNGLKKPAYWEKVIKTIIYCVSGQIPDRQEVLRGRQIISDLPRWFKNKHLDERFVLGFLPYILIGFKIHVEDRFQSDSNQVNNVCKFIVHLYAKEEIEMNSYLCAHRGFAPQGMHVLINGIHQKKAKKALNFQKAILANLCKPGIRKIHWYQQGPTAMASSNMFPEMFIQYLKNGKVPDILILLGKHFSELEGIFNEGKSGLAEAKIVSLDTFTTSTYAFLDCQYGTDWRITNFELSGTKRTPLIEIALDQVMSEIRRLGQFYGNSLDSQFLETRQKYLKKNLIYAQELENEGAIKDLAIKTVKAIDWFYYNQLMHITAKALYEAAFYYMWGRMIASQSDRIAVGIDRDHAEYQNSAWNMGYADSNEADLHTSVLYARRTVTEVPGSALRDFSLRQFWR